MKLTLKLTNEDSELLDSVVVNMPENKTIVLEDMVADWLSDLEFVQCEDCGEFFQYYDSCEEETCFYCQDCRPDLLMCC